MFKKGQSGNPAGKPKGALNRTTRAAQALLDGEAEALSRKAIELALQGDTMALRLCLERIIPPRKDRPVAIDLPKLEGAADVPVAAARLLAAVASGEITPSEGGAVASLLAEYRKAAEVGELEKRLAAIEKSLGIK